MSNDTNGISKSHVISAVCSVSPPSVKMSLNSYCFFRHRQNITPLSVATNVLSSTTPDRYAR